MLTASILAMSQKSISEETILRENLKRGSKMRKVIFGKANSIKRLSLPMVEQL
jgi:hypothetical protein